MSTFQFDESLRNALKALDGLPEQIERNLTRGALRAGAKPIQIAAKENVPVGKKRQVKRKLGPPDIYSGGDLRKSIRISASFKKRTNELKILVKAGNKKAWYAHLVEGGAVSHLIKGPCVLNGRRYMKINHPGATPHAFMRKAFDAKLPAVFEAYSEYMRANLPKVLQKYASSRTNR